MSVCLYLLCDIEVAGVDAVREQVLCAAALTGPKHTVVGLEQLAAGRTGQDIINDDDHIQTGPETTLPLYHSIYHPAKY